MNTYVVTSQLDGELVIELLTIQEVVNLIGYSDFNERSDIRVFRAIDQGGRFEMLTIVRMYKESCVYLEDFYGNYIEGSDYEPH